MKQGVIGSPRSDKHKVLAVARAPKEPFWKWPGVDPLNAFQSLVSYCHTAKQADLPHAFMCLLGFHTGAQGIHLVIIAMSIECIHRVCVIGLPTSCIVKSASGGGSLREGNFRGQVVGVCNCADMARKGVTQQLICLLLISDGQGSHDVCQSGLAICKLHWQRISIGLVPAFKQTL